MRKFKLIFLSALMALSLVTFTACGMGNNNNSGSEAPYDDDVKDTANNGVNNGGNGNNGNSGNNIGDEIQSGIDNVENGIQNGIDDIQDGMDNMQDGTQNNGGDMNNRGQRTSRLEEAGQNLMNSFREASAAIRDGINELSGVR